MMIGSSADKQNTWSRQANNIHLPNTFERLALGGQKCISVASNCNKESYKSSFLAAY